MIKTLKTEAPNFIINQHVYNGYFNCVDMELDSLEGCPEHINGSFDCSRNKLRSLEGGPTYVADNFKCSKNKLESLKGCPEEVGGNFVCSENKLLSLKGCPKIVHGGFNCSYNKLQSLKNINQYILKIDGIFYCHNNPIKSHILGLFLIKDIKGVYDPSRNYHKWIDILNKHIHKGRKGMLACQAELIENGLKEYAQL